MFPVGSDYAFLLVIPRMWYCVLLSTSHQEAHDVIITVANDLTLITLLKCYLSSFSSMKLLFCFVVNNLLGICVENYINILIFFRFSPSRFNIHWWFLPEPIITMIVAKWYISNDNISSFISSHFVVRKNFT